MIPLYVLLFITSCFLLYIASTWLISSLMRMAKFLGWREFVVAFFVMAFAGAIPNLFVGINSVLHKIPELSFGDIVGGNMVDLTLVVALAVLVGGASLPAKSKMVQSSVIFTVVIAILPLILILDGTLGRGEGLILIFAFIFYIFWLFSKEERFRKVYNSSERKPVRNFKKFLKDLGKIILSLILLLIASEGIVKSVYNFSEDLNIALPIISILIVGLANALPEAFFAIVSAKKGQSWMVLGNLMGSVIVPATLVLGIVALLSPIEIEDFSPYAIARIFLVISAILFFIFVRTGQKVTKKEALILLGVYFLFVIFEIFLS